MFIIMDDKIETKKHNLGDVWQRLHDQSKEIGDISREVAKTDAKLDALSSKLDTVVSAINRSLGDLASNVHRPTNWIGIGTLLFTVASGMVMFVVVFTSPLFTNDGIVRDRIDRIVVELEDRAYELGESDEARRWIQRELDHVDDRLAGLEEFDENASFIHGQREEMSERLEAIDNQGSRVWNDRPRSE